MPDYVYGLHDFEPEHEDEVPFKQGEPIEVIEKDDLYSDGWWQVRARLLSPYLSWPRIRIRLSAWCETVA